MKTMQLKNDLHRILDGLSAEKLAEVYSLVMRYVKQTDTVDFWDTLPDTTKVAIIEGLDQLESGDSVSYDSVRKEILEKCNF